MKNWDKWVARIKWILTCLVFFALPLILIAYGMGNRWRIQEADSIERSFAGLDAVLLGIRKQEDPSVYLSNLLTRIFRKAEASKKPEFVFELGMREMRRRFPGIFRFYFIDHQGNILPKLTEPNTSNWVLKKLHEAITEPDKEKQKKLLGKGWATLRNFIGPEASEDTFLALSGEIFEAAISERGRRFFYISGRKGAMFVHIDQPQDWHLISTRDLCRRFLKYRPHLGISVGIHDLSEPKSSNLEINAALKEFQRSTKQHFTLGEKFFSIMGFTTTARIWGTRPKSHAMSNDNLRIALTIIGTMLFSILSIVSFLVIVQERAFSFSIRWRLVVLFFFASGLPLAVVILAGWDYLHQKYRTRVRETHDEAERALRAFDSRFPQMRGVMEVTVEKLVRNFSFDNPINVAVTKKQYTRGNIFLRTSDSSIFDKLGKIIWENFPGKGKKIMGSMVKGIMSDLNEEKDTGPADSTAALVASFGGVDNPIAQLKRNLGKIIDFSMGGNKNWTFIWPMRSSDGRYRHTVVSYWKKHELEQLYIRKHLLNEQKSLGGIRLFAVNAARTWQCPKSFKYASLLNSFLRNLQLRQTTTFSQVKKNNLRLLVTGIKPKELADSYLVAIISDSAIQKEVRVIQVGLWLFSILSAIISVFLGIILSQRFLNPIKALSLGVEAIQKRHFEHRLPPGSRDELGDLARTFNQVMEGLSDLEIGRIVQESLFPKGEIKTGEYRAYGTSCSATELGGDYFDIQILSDDRILILIGDVSGHGVPAALVMAMAKALVERECEIDPKPSLVLASIHQILFKVLKRKRMMTCFLAVLNTKENKLYASNGGQNYPFVFPSDQRQPYSIEIRSKPLGSWKNNTFETYEYPFLPGDRLLLYTDGLVEAKSKEGVIGYDRMVSSIKPLLGDDPRASCERIFSWHRELTGSGPQEDDITIVLLTRQTA